MANAPGGLILLDDYEVSASGISGLDLHVFADHVYGLMEPSSIQRHITWYLATTLALANTELVNSRLVGRQTTTTRPGS